MYVKILNKNIGKCEKSLCQFPVCFSDKHGNVLFEAYFHQCKCVLRVYFTHKNNVKVPRPSVNLSHKHTCKRIFFEDSFEQTFQRRIDLR